MIREVPREEAPMIDGSPLLSRTCGWEGTALHPAPRGSVCSPRRRPAERLPDLGETGKLSWQPWEDVLRVSSQ